MSMKVGIMLNRINYTEDQLIKCQNFEPPYTYFESVVDGSATIENPEDFTSLTAGMPGE